jgi:hypothetical protein
MAYEKSLVISTRSTISIVISLWIVEEEEDNASLSQLV